MSKQAENSRARAAGMARATYGRNTRWRSMRGIIRDAEKATAHEAIEEAMAERTHDNRYCPRCRQTTRHEIQGSSLVCPRCNVVKYRR